ncbi:cardiolipin synthase ClsB [Comamonas sp. NLF-1-9]|uniref:cardiolipin synthase ClsB n=1 Tax=Comamonas sp. NLF-1-9 TaxID=2853163 RepID=UPI001C4827B9|nr:cardiolipin synthase ClsB [Comamonas sp. NLF-1-9]QXL85588.1 cardiolipin synthase ClsB [Comamonas sp. NLF-1-9]
MPLPAFAGSDHRIKLLQGSQEFFPALIAELDGAQRDVQFETYIFCTAGEGASVAAALERAARRGVRVRMVVDGVGTGLIAEPWGTRLVQAGVQLRVYSPLGPLGLLLPSRWRRLHRKLCVVDARVLFCGGINVLDDFEDPYRGRLEAPRLDFAVQVQGSMVAYACAVMDLLWLRMQAVHEVRRRQLAHALQDWRAAQTLHRLRARTPQQGRGVRAALLLRDNLRLRTRIERSYRRAIAQAREEIIIANAYFIPGGKLRRALVLAARRGVRVHLLLQGRYEYFMQYHAARPVYGALLAAGVHIHEYAPSFLHAKVAVVDAEGARPWATVGSSNLDPLSLLLAREANVMVRDAEFARLLRARLMQAIDGCEPLAAQTYASRPRLERALDHIAYLLMRAALWLTGKNY